MFYADDGFSEVQYEALATVIAELRREFDEAIERAQQRILATVVRLVAPGELAEQKIHSLTDRVSLLESHIERRIAKALTDSNVLNLPSGFWRRDAA